jgi:hypothetical protein
MFLLPQGIKMSLGIITIVIHGPCRIRFYEIYY